MPALKSGRWCWSHSPDNVAAHRANAKLGGTKRQRDATAPAAPDREVPQANLTTLDGCLAALGALHESLRSSSRNAKTLVTIIRESVAALKEREVAEVQRRLDELTAALEERRLAP